MCSRATWQADPVMADQAVRVLHIVEATFAGVGRHVLDLANAQSNAGDEVHVVYSGIRESESFRLEREASESITWHNVEMTRSISPSDLGAVRSVRAIVKAIEPDVVHGHSTKGGIIGRLVQRHGDVTFAYTPNAFFSMNPVLRNWEGQVIRAVEWALSKRTDVLIAVSPEEKLHSAELGIDPSIVTVIPNGIQPMSDVDRVEVRNALGIGEGAQVVGFVGRLDSQKAPERLLQIWSSLHPRFPSAELVIVGDGPDRAELERTVVGDSLGNVHFAGVQDGKWAMAAFDVFVLPSRYEGFPYVLLEAAFRSLPIVASVQTNSSYLAESYSGLSLIDGEDVDGFIGAIADALTAADHSDESELEEFTVSAMHKAVSSAYVR